MNPRVVKGLAAGVLGAVIVAAWVQYRQTESDRFIQWKLGYSDDGSINTIQVPGGSRISFRQDRDRTGRLIRIVKQVDGRDTASFRYDQFGRRTEMTDRDDTVRYEHDGFSRVTSMRRGQLPAVVYSYDTLNRLKTQRIGADWLIGYTYDFLGRIATIATPTGPITFEYLTGSGAVIRTLPNGVRTIQEFEPNGWLNTITHVSRTGEVLARFIYSYRMDGLIKEIAETLLGEVRSIQYEYDQWRRLTTVSSSAGDIVRYRYDRYGNRIAVTGNGTNCCEAAHDWKGRISEFEAHPTRHDTHGNLVAYASVTEPGAFAFDSENNLVSADAANSQARYGYDGESQLVRRTVAGLETRYVTAGMVDRWMPLAEVEGGRITAGYVWDGDVPVGSVRGSDAEFYLQDHLNSVRLVVDAEGRPKTALRYDPFGVPERPAESTELRPGFGGMFYDSQAHLYLTRFRAYSARLGRFLQIDPEQDYPLGTPESLSFYAYSADDPVNFTDRSGLQRSPAAATPTPVLDEMRNWEEQRNQLTREQLLERLSDKTAVTKAEDGQVREVLNASVSALMEMRIRDQYLAGLGFQAFTLFPNYVDGHYDPFSSLELLNRTFFGRTSYEIARTFRDAQNDALKRAIQARYRQAFPLFTNQAPRAHQTLIPAYRTLIPNSSARYATEHGAADLMHGISSTFMNFANATDATLKYVDKIGTSMMLANPTTHPLKLNLAEGIAEGHGSYAIPGGHVDYHEVVSQEGSGSSASVKQWQWDHATTGFGTVDRRRASSTPTSSPFARLMSILYPVGNQYDPGQTREVRSTHVRESYRVTTTGGNTVVTPLDKTPDEQGVGGFGGGGGGAPGGPSCGSSPALRVPVGASQPSAKAEAPQSFPTPVGGVFLRGAGDALRALGHISGVAFDPATGQIVLISSEGPFDLPPLPLDDLVTVFRTVYREGAPYVSIDPDPANPKGPWMRVRHDPGTGGTHAGWVLFESDRIMKSYSLGKDNVTRAPVGSRVPGYRDLFQLGFEQAGWGTARGNWERFWIVPDKVVRERTSDGTSTFLKLSLRVRTEPMVLEGGKLQSRPNAKPSWAADQFSSWFTGSYASIANEALTAPPGGLGVQERSLTELERIALIAGAAEALRDDGVPLPAWMLDYPVPALRIPLETPSMTDNRPHPSKALTLQIYGGVNLAADDKDLIKAKASPEQEQLAAQLLMATRAASPLTPVSVTHGGKEYRAVALPGSETTAEGALVLEAVDLAVDLTPRQQISLTRRTSSFSHPEDLFGPAWSLDLPRLYEQKLPLRREKDSVIYRQVWQLASPLNSYSGYFTDGVAHAKDSRIGTETIVIHPVTPGEQWHFSENGCLTGLADPPVMVVYRTDKDCRVQRIDGWVGFEQKAQINLNYDARSRLVSAVSSDGQRATYDYDSEGALRQVNSPSGAARYEYENGLLTMFTDSWGTERFAYDQRGQRRDIPVAPAAATAVADPDAASVSTHGFTTTVRLPEGGVWEVTRDAEGRTLSVRQDGQEALRQSWRQDGLLEAARYETFSLLPQYSSDGTLTTVLIAAPEDLSPSQSGHRQQQDPSVRHVSFAPARGSAAIAWSPVAATTLLRRWLRIDVGQNEQPERISDYTGYDMRVTYDPSGAITHIATERGNMSIHRDARGLPAVVETSWGLSQRYEYEGNGLRRVTIRKGEESTVLDYQDGTPTRVKSFDGSEFRFSYDTAAKDGDSMTVEGPDNVSVRYGFNADGQLTRAQIVGLYTVQYTINRSGCLGGCGISR